MNRNAINSSDRKAKKNKKKKFNIFFDVFIPVFLIGVIIYASVNLVEIYKSYSEAKEIYDGVALYVSDETTLTGDSEENVIATQMIEAGFPYINVDFEALKEINSDFLGWIYFPLLEISYPVVYGDADMSYLHMAIDKTPSNSGCIYIDSESNPNLEDKTTLIFGHNMRNGSMFGSLKRIRQEKGLIYEDPYFYFYTEDRAYKCHIFAYYLDEEGSVTYLLGEKNNKGYDEYLDYVLEKNEYENGSEGMDFSHRPKLIGLSTCSGHNTGKRTVLQAIVEDTYEINETTNISSSFDSEIKSE